MQAFIMKFCTLVALCCFSSKSIAQQNHNISGTIKDKKNGELLIGVTVKVAEMPNVGVVANEYGFFSLSLPKGNYTLIISYMGYKVQQLTIPMKVDTSFRSKVDSYFADDFLG